MMYRRTGRPKGLDLSITAPTIRSQSLPCSGEGTTYIPASQGFSAFTVGRRVATLAASCRGYARASAPADQETAAFAAAGIAIALGSVSHAGWDR
jgi:hypothetical protein